MTGALNVVIAGVPSSGDADNAAPSRASLQRGEGTGEEDLDLQAPGIWIRRYALQPQEAA